MVRAEAPPDAFHHEGSVASSAINASLYQNGSISVTLTQIEEASQFALSKDDSRVTRSRQPWINESMFSTMVESKLLKFVVCHA